MRISRRRGGGGGRLDRVWTAWTSASVDFRPDGADERVGCRHDVGFGGDELGEGLEGATGGIDEGGTGGEGVAAGPDGGELGGGVVVADHRAVQVGDDHDGEGVGRWVRGGRRRARDGGDEPRETAAEDVVREWGRGTRGGGDAGDADARGRATARNRWRPSERRRGGCRRRDRGERGHRRRGGANAGRRGSRMRECACAGRRRKAVWA